VNIERKLEQVNPNRSQFERAKGVMVKGGEELKLSIPLAGRPLGYMTEKTLVLSLSTPLSTGLFRTKKGVGRILQPKF